MCGARTTALALYGGLQGVGYAVRRPWMPIFLLAALVSRRARQALMLAALIELAYRRAAHPADAALLLSEDLIASAGTWWSCLREQTILPLLPTGRCGAAAPDRPAKPRT